MTRTAAPHLDTWYALAVVNGQEPAIVARLKDTIKRLKLQGEIRDVVLATQEETVDADTPQVRKVQRNKVPGYVLLRTRRLSPVAQVQIRQVKGVMEFLGAEDTPIPLPESEVRKLLGKEANARGAGRGPRFKVGGQVKIIAGPMVDFTGEVIEVTGTHVKVMIEIFGRGTPTEFEFGNVRPL